jgi:hypothetical protein
VQPKVLMHHSTKGHENDDYLVPLGLEGADKAEQKHAKTTSEPSALRRHG